MKRDESSREVRRHSPGPSRKADPSALFRLLEEWMRGNENEQRDTFEFLRRSLDEGRPDGCKLFS